MWVEGDEELSGWRSEALTPPTRCCRNVVGWAPHTCFDRRSCVSRRSECRECSPNNATALTNSEEQHTNT